mmetsp:Transcript_9192/g.27597  ORF Transcript_9192/g.27597 Transcript_9192/m.27597 type:complete len:231 (+) Transcript_9192:1581-2273(+)
MTSSVRPPPAELTSPACGAYGSEKSSTNSAGSPSAAVAKGDCAVTELLDDDTAAEEDLLKCCTCASAAKATLGRGLLLSSWLSRTLPSLTRPSADPPPLAADKDGCCGAGCSGVVGARRERVRTAPEAPKGSTVPGVAEGCDTDGAGSSCVREGSRDSWRSPNSPAATAAGATVVKLPRPRSLPLAAIRAAEAFRLRDAARAGSFADGTLPRAARRLLSAGSSSSSWASS